MHSSLGVVQWADLGYFDFIVGLSGHQKHLCVRECAHACACVFSFVWRWALSMFPRLTPNSWAQVSFFLQLGLE